MINMEKRSAKLIIASLVDMNLTKNAQLRECLPPWRSATLDNQARRPRRKWIYSLRKSNRLRAVSNSFRRIRAPRQQQPTPSRQAAIKLERAQPRQSHYPKRQASNQLVEIQQVYKEVSRKMNFSRKLAAKLEAAEERAVKQERSRRQSDIQRGMAALRATAPAPVPAPAS